MCLFFKQSVHLGFYMRNQFLLTSILSTLFLTTANAGTSVGFGIGYTFGDGLVLGPKIFTEKREEKATASFGIDYAPFTNSFRPNIGVTYLTKNKTYAEINTGYNLKTHSISFGGSTGYADTKKKNNNQKEVKEPKIDDGCSNAC